MLVARVNRSCNFGTSITKPNIARRQPPTIRNVSGSSPSEAPKVARKIPTIAKESASPIPSAMAPQRCAFTAEATSTGIRGKTQGDSVDNAPASSPRPYVGSPKFIIAGSFQDTARRRRAARLSCCVSPVERALSLPFLNATMVLCFVTPSDLFNAFSVSKLATYRVSDLNSCVCDKSFSNGACARQVGHQSAWNTTATGFPAARVASNAAWSNGTSAEEARVAKQISINEKAAALRDFIHAPIAG